MEGVTGFPMRLWLHAASAPAAMTTPFLRVTRGQPEKGLPSLFAPELFALRGALPYELTPQFLAGDADNFLRAVEMLDHVPVPAIEINCGCPCPTCIGRFAGSGILAEPEVFAATVERLAAALGPGRLAVKMRLGFAATDEFPGLLPHVATRPLARLTVHGRTRAQGYGGEACWASIETAARAATAPTWGSGDVVDLSSYAAAQATSPSTAGILIGRGLLRNPWIFTELRSGIPTFPGPRALGHALVAFALLNHLAIAAPEKLVARVASGRLSAVCGTDADAWESLAAALSTLAFGAPYLGGLSPNVWPRLKYLWGFLRQIAPEAYRSPRLLRVKTLAEFFELIDIIDKYCD